MGVPVFLETAFLLDVKRVLVQGIAVVELEVLAGVKEILAEFIEERLLVVEEGVCPLEKSRWGHDTRRHVLRNAARVLFRGWHGR